MLYIACVDEEFLCLLVAIKSINDHFMESVFEGLRAVVKEGLQMDDDKRKIKDQIEQNIELFFEQNH